MLSSVILDLHFIVITLVCLSMVNSVNDLSSNSQDTCIRIHIQTQIDCLDDGKRRSNVLVTLVTCNKPTCSIPLPFLYDFACAIQLLWINEPASTHGCLQIFTYMIERGGIRSIETLSWVW